MSQKETTMRSDGLPDNAPNLDPLIEALRGVFDKYDAAVTAPLTVHLGGFEFTLVTDQDYGFVVSDFKAPEPPATRYRVEFQCGNSVALEAAYGSVNDADSVRRYRGSKGLCCPITSYAASDPVLSQLVQALTIQGVPFTLIPVKDT